MKRIPPLPRVLAGLMIAVAWTASSLPALAAEVPKLDKGNEGWVGVIIAIVLVVAVGVASFINPKRGHQD